MKIPGILADIGVAWLLFVIVRRWGGELDRSHAGSASAPSVLGLAVAALYLFNPGTIFDSAVWGQIDSVGTLVLLATIYALGRGWTEAAAVGAVVAMLVKFQFAFLIPIVVLVGLKRHLVGRSIGSRSTTDGATRCGSLTSLAAGRRRPDSADAPVRDDAVGAAGRRRPQGLPRLPAAGRSRRRA